MIVLYRRDSNIFNGLAGGAVSLAFAAAMGAAGLYFRLKAQPHLETGVIGAIIVGCQASAIVFIGWIKAKKLSGLRRASAAYEGYHDFSRSELLIAAVILLISCCFSLLKGTTPFLNEDADPRVGCAWAVGSGLCTAFGLCLLCNAPNSGQAIARAWVWEILIGVLTLCVLLVLPEHRLAGRPLAIEDLVRLSISALPGIFATVFYILATQIDKGLSRAAVIETTSVLWTAFFSFLILGESIGLGQCVLTAFSLMAVFRLSQEAGGRNAPTCRL
jgi:uncharacterized membrane protein